MQVADQQVVVGGQLCTSFDKNVQQVENLIIFL